MQFQPGPYRPTGKCRLCGATKLRDGETGVIVTAWWGEEPAVVVCEACAADLGRLAPALLAEFEAAAAELRVELDAATVEMEYEKQAELEAAVRRVKASHAGARTKLEAKHAAELANALGTDGESLWR